MHLDELEALLVEVGVQRRVDALDEVRELEDLVAGAGGTGGVVTTGMREVMGAGMREGWGGQSGYA